MNKNFWILSILFININIASMKRARQINLESDNKTKQSRKIEDNLTLTKKIISSLDASDFVSAKKQILKLSSFEIRIDSLTLLHYSIICNQIEIVRILISKGANINAKYNLDDIITITPLLMAIDYGYNDIVKELLNSKDLNIDEVGSSGLSALHIAIEKDNQSLVKLLLDHGAKPELKNSNCQTAFELAKEKNYLDLVLLLGFYKNKKQATLNKNSEDIMPSSLKDSKEINDIEKEIIELELILSPNDGFNLSRVEEEAIDAIIDIDESLSYELNGISDPKDIEWLPKDYKISYESGQISDSKDKDWVPQKRARKKKSLTK